jgi:aspartyl-tRNA(Asn)/glutamyl-tRNA(Gln) amidotransferase subunit C
MSDPSDPKAEGVTAEEILHLAKLSSLPVSSGEIASLTADLGRIIGHVEQVLRASAGPSGHTTTHHASSLPILREDVVSPGLTREEALAAAPETADGGFSVPTFVSG